jgi:hypothetical protein
MFLGEPAPNTWISTGENQDLIVSIIRERLLKILCLADASPPARRNCGTNPPTQMKCGEGKILERDWQFLPISNALEPCSTGTSFFNPTS